MKKLSVIINGLLLALCLYAVGCCGFHILPEWSSSDYYESINAVLLSLALSYIAAFVFYVLLTWWPMMQKRNVLYDVWKGDMANVYMYMGDAITDLMLYVGITKEIKCIELKDCSPVRIYDSNKNHVFHHIVYILNGESREHPDGIFQYHRNLRTSSNVVYGCIEKMLQNPLTGFAKPELALLLSNIKTSKFVSTCRSMTDKQDSISVEYMDFDKALYHYVELYRELGCYSFEKREYKKTPMTDEEIVKYHQDVENAKKTSGLTDSEINEIAKILMGRTI